MIDLENRKLSYFIPSVMQGKIVIEKLERNIYKNDKIENLIKDKYLTEDDASNAINKVLPKAVKHYELCLSEYVALAKKLNFAKGFHYEGDTHGIYNEYDYISFKIDGFDFQFEIN